MHLPVATPIAVSLLAACCAAAAGCRSSEPPLYFDPYLGTPLDADLDEPLLLTVAAPRDRAAYLVDEGYTLTRDDEGTLSFATDTAGDLGLAIVVDGELIVLGDEQPTRPTVRFTGSDAIVLDDALTDSLTLELRFAAVTSQVATAELWLRNEGDDDVDVEVMPFLRRCYDPYLNVRSFDGGVTARHDVDVPEEQQLVGQGTYVARADDALVVEGDPAGWTVLENCSHVVADDVARLDAGGTGPPNSVAAIALHVPLEVPAGGRSVLRVHRALADADGDDPDGALTAAIDDATHLVMEPLLEQSYARLADIPALGGLDRDADLVYRSSFVLLDQLMMPAEGNLDHDYYVFSREPTWWFARLGQHTHESLAMLAMARYQPELAMASHRVFTDRVEDDGYLPYSVGPVVEQTVERTATAPLLAYEGLRIADVTGDEAFLAEAYEAAAAVHGFWVEQRDADGDGLCEFGGFNVTETVRDLNNVIWAIVDDPGDVEAVDLNSWLAMEERALATMASRLGRDDEAAAWTAAHEARAALINEVMWDEETSFYYPVERETNSFSYAEPGDLRRREIAGFMPLWAGIVPEERLPLVLGQLADPYGFLRPWGVPSLAADDPQYDPEASECCKWDGPAWVQWEYLLVRALLDLGETALAEDITGRTFEAVRVQLAATHQFRELYDPEQADRPNEAMPNYVWSPLVALMMLEVDEASR